MVNKLAGRLSRHGHIGCAAADPFDARPDLAFPLNSLDEALRGIVDDLWEKTAFETTEFQLGARLNARASTSGDAICAMVDS
jgi:hypothetical protein